MPYPNPIIIPIEIGNPENEAANAALKSTFAIASVGIATLNMLETLLPAAANEVEMESRTLTDNFVEVIKYVAREEVPPHVTAAIGNIIVAMQFQDRNTQIMENVACILERYRSMLEDVCRNIESTRETDMAASLNIARAVDDILSSIRLSDIRTRYIEALAKAKVHSHAEAASTADRPAICEEIELF